MTRKIQNSQKLAGDLSKSAVIRAAIVAIVIGSVLTLINQRAAFFGAEEIAILPLILVFQTPFLVVLASQMLAIRRATLDYQARIGPAKRERFLETLTAHEIPLRAIILGGLMGTLNTAIIGTANILSTGAALPLPTTLIAQAYTLPVLFGFVSQSLAYRRAIAEIARPKTHFVKGE